MPRAHQVVVDVVAPAADVQRRIGRWATVTATVPGTCRAVMTADDLEWPVLALAQLDADFTVVEPPELVARVRSSRPVSAAPPPPEAPSVRPSGLGEVAEAAEVGPPDPLQHGTPEALADPAAHRHGEHEILGPANSVRRRRGLAT